MPRPHLPAGFWPSLPKFALVVQAALLRCGGRGPCIYSSISATSKKSGKNEITLCSGRPHPFPHPPPVGGAFPPQHIRQHFSQFPKKSCAPSRNMVPFTEGKKVSAANMHPSPQPPAIPPPKSFPPTASSRVSGNRVALVFGIGEDLHRGGPDSATQPPSKNRILVGHVAGELHISCVTTIMVMPTLLGELAHDAQNLSTQFRVERWSGFVKEHHLAAPSPAPARWRHACCCPPESCDGYASPRCSRPTFCQQIARARSAESLLILTHAFTTVGPSPMFFKTVRCGKRLNDWGTMAGAHATVGAIV